MKKHESGCTMNPHRVCRVCKMVQGVQESIDDLMSILPPRPSWLDNDPEVSYFTPHLREEFEKALNASLPQLRDKCSNCPACIMAALRQKKIPVPMATDFNWTNEMKDVWDEINTARYEGVSV